MSTLYTRNGNPIEIDAEALTADGPAVGADVPGDAEPTGSVSPVLYRRYRPVRSSHKMMPAA